MLISIIEIDYLISYQVCMTWLNWLLKLHSSLRTIPHLIHNTTHKFNVQWIPISFVWLYMFKCDVCVLNHMWIKPKRFLFFLFAFGSDLYHPCFSKFFKLFFVWKTRFLSVFVTHFIRKLNWELNGPNLMFFNFV